MSIIKRKYNSLSYNTNPIPWGTAATIIVPGDNAPTSTMNLSSARLRLTISFQGATGPVTITAPAITWISSYTITITYKVGSNAKGHSVIYTGMNGRGDAGYLYSLWTRSAPNTAMQTFPEVLSSRTITGSLTEESIPIMFLLDSASTERWVPIQQITMSLNFKPLNQLMFCPNSPTFNASVTNYWFDFSSGYIGPNMPRELCLPDPRRTFMYNVPILSPITSTNQILAIPGKPLAIFYWFFNQTAATLTSPATYNLNPNPFSVTTYHQIAISGHTFPLEPQYFTTYDATGNNTGTSRHYDEFLMSVNKYMPDKNTSITYDDWLSNHRIYSILMNDVDVFDTIALPLQIIMSSPTVNPCNLYIAVQYLPSSRH
jgi:hypothetical protein